jgi:hypothetical protein
MHARISDDACRGKVPNPGAGSHAVLAALIRRIRAIRRIPGPLGMGKDVVR